jgi:hypothetical protein
MLADPFQRLRCPNSGFVIADDGAVRLQTFPDVRSRQRAHFSVFFKEAILALYYEGALPSLGFCSSALGAAQLRIGARSPAPPDHYDIA